MGRMKELMIQMQEDVEGVKLAEILGISYLELDSLDYKIHKKNSKDGLIYNYYIEFDKKSPKEILAKIERLEDGIVYLDPSELDDYYDEDYYDEDWFNAIISNKNYYDTFLNEIENLKKLLGITIDEKELQEILHRQIFISVFGSLETFLSDTFINLTIESDSYLKNFIQTHPKFKQDKFELKQIFEEYAKIKDTAKQVMLDTIYHDLHKVKLMYSMTFEIEFPDSKDLFKLVLIRHHLVHRNGKTKEGEKITIANKEINELIEVVSLFVKDIAIKLGLHSEMSNLPF